MLRALTYLLSQKKATAKELFPDLDQSCLGLPELTAEPCAGSDCHQCEKLCPTRAITVSGEGAASMVTLDLGACIGCSVCIDTCPTGTITRNLSTKTAVTRREDLLLSNTPHKQPPVAAAGESESLFKRSLAIRVVSTGCSSCDLEVAASANPIFDIERFGVQVVASPRFADAILITGPVGESMKAPLLSCYDAMPEPRKVVAVGTCAISGGMHKDGYAKANGATTLLKIDAFVPGCPPHPWSIIHGIFLAMGKTLRADE